MRGPLVDVAWLAQHLGPRLVVADVRWYLDGRSGYDAYLHGHIPTSVFIDLDTVLAAPPGDGPGRHPLPPPEVFAAAMGELGVGDEDVVVAYDDAGGSVAARLWWMLDAQGRETYVLDGGLPAWQAHGEAMEQGAGTARAPRPFTARPWPQGRIVDADGVSRALRSGAVVLDARAPERYAGAVEPVDPRAGHIPGATSAPWAANLAPGRGVFLSPEALRDRYARLGVGPSAPVVYCGSGVTACHDLLALRVAGLPDGMLYEGSWSDWSSDPARPVAVGDEPGAA